jgi:hypothetical protein
MAELLIAARTATCIAALSLISVVGCRVAAPRHSDGHFEDLSGFQGPFWTRGYSVTLPNFDLGQRFETEYRLVDLPEIAGKSCVVYLVVPESDSLDASDKASIRGQFGFELRDGSGTTVAKASGRLGEYRWSTGREATHALYLDNSSFIPNPNEVYRLHVVYEPDERLVGLKGHVLLRSGGAK